VTVRHMYAATAASDKGQFQGAVPKGRFLRAAPRADGQLVYIESYSPPFLSLVSSIVAIYRAPFTE
jgi:hypothetical protein